MKDKSKLLRFFLYVLAVVLINIAGITLFFRLDLTANRIYSLSEASREAVSTLSDPLTVKVFFSNSLPAPYNNIERYLHDLLEEYSVAGNRYFNYQFYNMSGEEGREAGRNEEIAHSYGIQPVQIQNIEQDEVKFQKAYMGIALIHGDVTETIQTIRTTEGLEYKLTSAIRRMNSKISALLRLEDKISVKLFLSSSLRAVGPYMNINGLAGLPGEIRDIVEELNDKNYGKLRFTYLDPAVEPAAEKEAENYGIMRLEWDSFRDRQGRDIPADRGYAGIVVEHDESFQKIKIIDVFRLPLFGTQYQLTELDQLEKSINETVESVIDINEEIAWLADHGTLSPGTDMSMTGQMHQQEALSNLNKLLSEEYTVTPVELKDRGISEGMSSMVIAGAKEKFTEYELFQIDQFLMKGNNLAVFADSFKEISAGQGMGRQQPVYLPNNTGLEKLLSHYGVDVKKSVVLDRNCYEQKMPQAFGGGKRKVYFAPVIRNDSINKDAEFMANIKGLVMLKASPLEINKKRIKDNGISAMELFSSSNEAWEMSGRINFNPMFMSPPSDEDELKRMTMAYVLEGPFTSYFADKPVPEKKGSEGEDRHGDNENRTENLSQGLDMSAVRGEGIKIEKGKPAKIFIIGTSEILKDNVVDEEGNTPNAQFVMNVIDYLNDREEIAVMRSKSQKFNPLKEISPAARTGIKTANIAGLPVLVIISGIVVWFRRSARKRMIQKMFTV